MGGPPEKSAKKGQWPTAMYTLVTGGPVAHHQGPFAFLSLSLLGPCQCLTLTSYPFRFLLLQSSLLGRSHLEREFRVPRKPDDLVISTP